MQTISYELAKRLYELGVKKQSSYMHLSTPSCYKSGNQNATTFVQTEFYLYYDGEKVYYLYPQDINLFGNNGFGGAYPAYTLDEILEIEILPKNIYTNCDDKQYGSNSDVVYHLNLTTLDKYTYYIGYGCIGCTAVAPGDGCYLAGFSSENPAEAAGELLAWCIENGHVKVEDLCKQ
jgi:hypothetical protein